MTQTYLPLALALSVLLPTLLVALIALRRWARHDEVVKALRALEADAEALRATFEARELAHQEEIKRLRRRLEESGLC